MAEASCIAPNPALLLAHSIVSGQHGDQVSVQFS
jgi:hypothetical protein